MSKNERRQWNSQLSSWGLDGDTLVSREQETGLESGGACGFISATNIDEGSGPNFAGQTVARVRPRVPFGMPKMRPQKQRTCSPAAI